MEEKLLELPYHTPICGMLYPKSEQKSIVSVKAFSKDPVIFQVELQVDGLDLLSPVRASTENREKTMAPRVLCVGVKSTLVHFRFLRYLMIYLSRITLLVVNTFRRSELGCKLLLRNQ